MYKVKIGKQGRLVLPKEFREAYKIGTGDEVTIMVRKNELTMHIRKIPEDPLEDLSPLSKKVSIGLSPKDLKKRADEERMKKSRNLDEESR